MRRHTIPATPTTVIIPKAVWDDLAAQLSMSRILRQDEYAVLIGTNERDTITVQAAVADEENEDDRMTKRRYALTNDLDTVGQCHAVYDDLDLTLARTTREQQGRRQDNYSLPDGHVFLHVHHIAGDITVSAHIVKNHELQPAIVTIKDNNDPTTRKSRRARRKHHDLATSNEPTSESPEETS
jgi:hypothetical protein